MASVNGGSGSLSWGIVPLDWNSSNLATMSYSYRGNYLKSANDQLRYQIQWFYAGNNEGTEPVNSGDLVNVIFKVETSVDSVNWKTIGTVKKSRDIANRRYKTGTVAGGHRFTIDVSQLVSDELSYSLCPINKGTWQSPFYGGMNGGLTMQDNVIGSNAASGYPISSYNVSENGTFRRLRVSATFEVLDGNGQIVAATNTKSSPPYVTVINSVNQFEKDTVYYNQQFIHDKWSTSSTSPKRFNTRCPNWYHNTDANKVAYNKSVRMDEEAEFLQWYVKETYNGNDSGDYYNLIELYGKTFTADGVLENEFVLADFTTLLDLNNSTSFAHYQNRMLIQNVSPSFINANAFAPQEDSTGGLPVGCYNTPISPITANTHRYRLYFRGFYNANNPAPNPWIEVRHSAVNWYEIDREDEKNAYGFVRFHWLNSMGGIDSYTAKRDVVEGLTISRDVVERKSGDRTWYQDDRGYANNAPFNIPDNDFYVSDTMRGGDIYKGGREVSNVNADRVQSVYTEPLNKSVAKWLEEMLLSPNVWIEMDTEATQMGYARNPYLRPSDKGYIPVIITNSDAETVNQAEGLVKFNIEYTLAHKVITQRN
jgi:hypothetical protein